MILETRQIAFSPSALIKMLRWFSQAQGQKNLPLGLVTNVELKQEPLVLATNIQKIGGTIKTVILDEATIITVILYYCRQQRIPIARTARKTLRVHGDLLILDLSRRMEVPAPPM
ncbi:conserved hypothetical protein [uncultured Gammaproteobacteria bacterium]